MSYFASSSSYSNTFLVSAFTISQKPINVGKQKNIDNQKTKTKKHISIKTTQRSSHKKYFPKQRSSEKNYNTKPTHDIIIQIGWFSTQQFNDLCNSANVDNMKTRQQGEDPGNQLEFHFDLRKLFISVLCFHPLL